MLGLGKAAGRVWRKLIRKNVIRKKLLLYFLVTSILVNSICLYTYNNTRVLISQLNQIFLNDVALTNLSNSVADVENSIKSYLTTSHSEDLDSYLYNSSKLQKQLGNQSFWLDADLTNAESELLLLDIRGMIKTYLEYTKAAESGKRGRNIEAYSQSFNEAGKIYGYITKYIDKLKIHEFQENNTNYIELNRWLEALQLFNMAVILAAMAVNVVLIFWFVYSLTDPILRLSKAAGEIADGNYDVGEVAVEANDEIRVLALTFNRMAESIRRQLVEIRQKAEIESRLHDQELQNLKMASMLSDAELKSLQAQINPHFMFNTLNAGMQLAMFEGAERTQAFMERLSESLRYNLGNIDKSATLSQEVENIDNYIYLLRERFGDKLTFVKRIEYGLPDVPMPRMILQPIVENAFMHGIAGMESGGVITLTARRVGGAVRVEVADNGAGMDAEAVERALEGGLDDPAPEQTQPGHGIGLRNVIGRLILYYGAEGAHQLAGIQSGRGEGTVVTLTLPCALRGEAECTSC